MNFESFGSLCSSFLGLLISLGIDVELGQEILDITLLLNNHKSGLEFLIESPLLVAISLAWWLSASSIS